MAELATTRSELAEARKQLQQLRDYRAAAAALGAVGKPRFRTTKKTGYWDQAVERLMVKLQDRVKEGPAAVLHLLAFHGLELERYCVGAGNYYEHKDIEDYFTKVRKAMVEVIRNDAR